MIHFNRIKTRYFSNSKFWKNKNFETQFLLLKLLQLKLFFMKFIRYANILKS